jgi:hypothetical protein
MRISMATYAPPPPTRIGDEEVIEAWATGRYRFYQSAPVCIPVTQFQYWMRTQSGEGFVWLSE